jgi:BlaI family transcriptional regulator, penicillinase repressor
MKKLNEKEEQVMQIIWRLGKAFVKEIYDDLEEPKPPITTLSSLVRKLETEGWLDHEAFGKTHRYFPLIAKEDYRKYSFRDMVDNYFGGSPTELLSYFVEEEQNADAEETAKLLELIKQLDKK